MKCDKLEAKALFIKCFIDKLGDVKNWKHTGNVIDLEKVSGHCICGHPIRYQYELENIINKNIAYVGSECINHFQDYSPDLYNSLIATVERIKAEEKAYKELLMNEKIKEIADPYKEKVSKIFAWYKEKFPKWCYDYILWRTVNKITFEPKKVYKSLKVIYNWYVKNNKIIEEVIAKYGI